MTMTGKRGVPLANCETDSPCENKMIIPMVARPVRDPFDCEGLLFELKCLGSHADNAHYDRT